MTKEQILALIKKGSVTVTGLLKGEEVTSEHIKEMDKKTFYENYVGHTDVYDLKEDKKEEDEKPEPTDPKPADPKQPEVPTEPEDPKPGNTNKDQVPPVEEEPHVMPKDYVPGENRDKATIEVPGTDEGESEKPKKPAATSRTTKKTATK